jgi:hypothetical protein
MANAVGKPVCDIAAIVPATLPNQNSVRSDCCAPATLPMIALNGLHLQLLITLRRLGRANEQALLGRFAGLLI